MDRIIGLGLASFILLVTCTGVYAQTVSCPAPFSEVSRSNSLVTCRYQQTLSAPVSSGEDPALTAEGQDLLKASNVACKNVMDGTGVLSDAGGIGNDRVFAICLITPDRIIPSPPPPEPVPPPEVLDFDQVGEIVINETEFAVASSMVALCKQLQGVTRTAAQQDLLDRCFDINREPDALKKLAAVGSISPKQYTGVTQLVNYQTMFSMGRIGSRLAAMRSALTQHNQDTASNKRGAPLPSVVANKTISVGNGAGDLFDSDSPFGMYTLATQSEGDREVTPRTSGFDYKNQSFTLGGDYVWNASTIIGAAFGYGKSQSDFANQGGEIELKAYSLNVYMSKVFAKSWYWDAIVGYGLGGADNKRAVNFNANNKQIQQVADSEFDVRHQFVSIGLGHHISRPLFDINLAARLNYVNVDNEAFSERINDTSSSGFGLALALDEHQLESTSSELSAKFSKPFSVSWGVLVPEFQARWVHQWEGSDTSLSGRFLADTSNVNFTQSGLNIDDLGEGLTVFTVPLDDVDEDYATLSLGASVLLPKQATVAMRVSKSAGINNFSHYYYSLMLRKDF